MELLLTVALTVTVIWFLAEPHFAARAVDAPLPDSSRENLEEQRIRCVQLLKDLELDSSLKKISTEDYEQMKSALTVELATVLERLDRAS